LVVQKAASREGLLFAGWGEFSPEVYAAVPKFFPRDWYGPGDSQVVVDYWEEIPVSQPL
jgi:hypothetical protein